MKLNIPDNSPSLDFRAKLFNEASSSQPSPFESWEPPTIEILSAELIGYEIECLIGKGGMGAVYRCSQESLNRKVAIKVLPLEYISNPTFLLRFEQEAKAMAELNHPNIVEIFDFGTSPSGYPFIVMEYVDGSDFRALINESELDTNEVLEAISQIAKALQYAHSKGYVHRDIKPANIFLSKSGKIKIGDFGVAKLISEQSIHKDPGLTLTGSSIGTPDYQAPEQLLDGNVDHRADIYSLGVMLYEMLTGKLPRGIFESPSSIAPVDIKIDQVVLKALQANPEKRYQAALEIENDVIKIIKGKPVKATSKSKLKKSIFFFSSIFLLFIAFGIGIATLPLLKKFETTRPLPFDDHTFLPKDITQSYIEKKKAATIAKIADIANSSISQEDFISKIRNAKFSRDLIFVGIDETNDAGETIYTEKNSFHNYTISPSQKSYATFEGPVGYGKIIENSKRVIFFMALEFKGNWSYMNKYVVYFKDPEYSHRTTGNFGQGLN